MGGMGRTPARTIERDVRLRAVGCATPDGFPRPRQIWNKAPLPRDVDGWLAGVRLGGPSTARKRARGKERRYASGRRVFQLDESVARADALQRRRHAVAGHIAAADVHHANRAPLLG